MPTVQGDYNFDGSVVQTDRFGIKYTSPEITANEVIELDADASAAPEDGAVVAVDTDAAGGDVALTLDEILPGAKVTVLNVGSAGQVDLSGGDGVTLSTNEAGTSLPAAEGAQAMLTHVRGGEVFADGDLEANV